MGKLLRVFVYIFFVLVIFVLTLDILLFQKREMLKGRTQKMENTLVAIGSTIEAEAAKAGVKPDYPECDTDECTSELIENPTRSTFWETYKSQLEVSDIAKLDINRQRDALKSYYRLDPETGEPAKDENGRKIIRGEGTTLGVLTNALGRSTDQLRLLKDTRKQMVTLRDELVGTIKDLNQRKQSLRESLDTTVQRDRTISRLQDEISQLKRKIEELDDLIRSLQDNIADLKNQIQEKEREIETTEHKIKTLVAEIEMLTKGSTMGVEVLYQMPKGLKGQVISVNRQWSYVLIRLSSEFLSELTADATKPIPKIELTVKRQKPDGSGYEFITKIKLDHIRVSEMVGVCDVLTNWEQAPIQAGDAVFL